MPQFVDCYSLLRTRSKVKCDSFLDSFALQRIESADEYLINGNTFNDISDAMKYLEENPHEDYGLYWRNANEHSIFKHVMIFYTNDGNVILGLSVVGNSDFSLSVKEGYQRLIQFTSSKINCVTVEEPPPSSTEEFIQFSNKRKAPNWF
jgi:hypothetical protein